MTDTTKHGTEFDEKLDKIEEVFTKIVETKLQENAAMVETKLNILMKNTKTYADSVKNLENSRPSSEKAITSILKATKNNELVENQQRELRPANGINESTDAADNQASIDEMFIDSFLKIIGITSRPLKIIRLGKRNDNNTRPVKLVMNSSAEKIQLMSRLCNLKNANEIYRKLSIRDDYTIEEREEIREWVNKAEQRNENENTQAYVWKVRGSPKNGLRLVKITK